MSKRINVYLSDDDISILGDIGGKDLIKLAKKGLSDTDNVSVPLSSQNRDDCKSRQDDCIDNGLLSMLEKIYDDTQKIVGEIEKRKTTPNKTSTPSNIPDWLINLSNDRYEHYIKMFDNDKGRGTGDRDIRSTFVKDVGENSVNKELWAKLIQYVLASGYDWTEYIPEELEPTLYSNNK